MKKSTVLKAAIGLNTVSLLWYMLEYGIILGIVLWTIVSFIWALFLIFFVGPIILLTQEDEVKLPSWANKIKDKFFPSKED